MSSDMMPTARWDGDTLCVHMAKLPNQIRVTTFDRRGREVYSARVHRYEPERGECRLEINTDMTAVRCDRCGGQIPYGVDLTMVRYCPNCGRKVVDA